MQYLEVLSNDDLKIDNVDTALSCVRLKWQQKNDGDGYLLRKEYGRIVMDSICGFVIEEPIKD